MCYRNCFRPMYAITKKGKTATRFCFNITLSSYTHIPSVLMLFGHNYPNGNKTKPRYIFLRQLNWFLFGEIKGKIAPKRNNSNRCNRLWSVETAICSRPKLFIFSIKNSRSTGLPSSQKNIASQTIKGTTYTSCFSQVPFPSKPFLSFCNKVLYNFVNSCYHIFIAKQ